VVDEVCHSVNQALTTLPKDLSQLPFGLYHQVDFGLGAQRQHNAQCDDELLTVPIHGHLIRSSMHESFVASRDCVIERCGIFLMLLMQLRGSPPRIATTSARIAVHSRLVLSLALPRDHIKPRRAPVARYRTRSVVAFPCTSAVVPTGAIVPCTWACALGHYYQALLQI
jgi:hypothetical protein